MERCENKFRSILNKAPLFLYSNLPMLRNPNIAYSIRGEHTGNSLNGFIVVITTIAGDNDSDEADQNERYFMHKRYTKQVNRHDTDEMMGKKLGLGYYALTCPASFLHLHRQPYQSNSG